MARRRKKNPLLTRILVISVLAHVIALPIAARFGAFDKIKREFGSANVVMVTVPPLEAEKKAVEKAEKPHKAPPAAKRSGVPTAKASEASKSNIPQPKVVAAAGGGDGADGGPSVDPNGSGKAGQLPTGPTSPGTSIPTTPTEPGPTHPEPELPKPPVEPPAPPAEPKPQPVPPKPTPPVPKRIVGAEVTYAPEPTIPEDLRSDPFEKTLVVEADVDEAGRATNVQVSETTGVRELDEVGLGTARQYRFHPATVDGTPVVSHVRFRIIFKVE